MNTLDLDRRTPILVGVGQSAERLADADYRGLSAVDLAAIAGSHALRDSGASVPGLVSAVDTVAGVRQFEISTPRAHAPLGRSNNFPRSVAQRLGCSPRRAILDVAGGQAPQHLVTELAEAILAGTTDVALLFGAEALSTARQAATGSTRPDFSEQVDGDLDDRGFGLAGLSSRYQVSHGLVDAPTQYALFENARRARIGASRSAYARAMGELFAPFTQVAARNPLAAAPVPRSALDLVTATERNRVINDPYTRFLVSRDQVNQGAAVLMMSVEAADRMGVPEGRRVFLHGHADLRELPLLERPDLSANPAAVAAVRHALDVAQIGLDDVDSLDLYSCFPIAVLALCDGLGLEPHDPRGLTLTGGLPFFGGPGNNYSMHAIAETVERCRATPGSYGLVGANGGLLSKYSVGIYSTTATAWRPDRSAEIQENLDALPRRKLTQHANGPGVIETYTVAHARDGSQHAVVIGRLDATGDRFLAVVDDDDEEMLDVLRTDEPIGRSVEARTFGSVNRVSTTRSRMDARHPRRTPAFRDSYDHVLVQRDGHVLEVVINRPAVRNALHFPAHDELAEVFDAYENDRDLWVAILTGAGEKSFCAGQDLVHIASGAAGGLPLSGFGGLTSRPLTKPVIAAVNGVAMGGGFELALACHLVVADQHATFALSEVRVGLVAGAGGIVRLPRTIPVKIATELILTGRSISASDAVGLGLVNRVATAGTVLESARELAEQIVSVSPTSVRLSLRMLAEAQMIADPLNAIDASEGALDDLMSSEDAYEGLSAFAAKRPPQWRNR